MKKDQRNTNALMNILRTLDNTGMFEIGYGDPSSGNAIIKFNGVCYDLSITPTFSRDGDKKYAEEAFEDVVKSNFYRLK